MSLSISSASQTDPYLVDQTKVIPSIGHLKLHGIEALSEMDLTFSPHAIPFPYVQENTTRARLCQRADFDQNSTDFYAQHHKTDTTYLTPEHISNVAYIKRHDIDSVGVQDEEERIAEMFANQNYQNDLELMLGFNTDIEMTQGVALQPNQQVSPMQSLHLNLQGQSIFDVDDRHPATISNTESLCNPGWTSHLEQDVFSESTATMDFSNGMCQPQHELPSSFKTNSTSGFSFSTVDSWPPSTRCDESLHQPLQSWELPTTQVSNNVRITEVNSFPCDSSEPCLTVPLYVMPSQTSATTASSYGFSPSLNSPFDYASPMNEMMSSQVPSPLPTEERRSRDELLIECRRANMSYKEIKEQYGFEQSISTLRGRYRNLTKQKHERLRKPSWTSTDVSKSRLYGREIDV